MKVIELKQAPQAELVADTDEFRKFAARVGIEVTRPMRPIGNDQPQGLVVRVPATGEVIYVQFDDWLISWSRHEFTTMDNVSFRRRFNVWDAD